MNRIPKVDVTTPVLNRLHDCSKKLILSPLNFKKIKKIL
jgi:hypothetical protein